MPELLLHLINYRQNNTINLMSSIIHGFGGKSQYNQIRNLTEEIKNSKNVVLLVIDGLGSDSLRWLKKKNPKSFLAKHFFQDLHSVFPPTTTAAITTFNTGLAPQEHGLVSWFMYLREFKQVGCILPYVNRYHQPFNKKIKFDFPSSIYRQLKARSYVIFKKSFSRSRYNHYLSAGAEKLGINNFGGLLRKVRMAVRSKSRQKRKYVYAYWGEYDAFCHHYGKGHPKSQKHLLELDKKLSSRIKELAGTDTLLLITADHGLVTTPLKNHLLFNRIAPLKECLELPLGGDSRSAFCYIKPNKKLQFEQYVKYHLKKYCTLHTPQELVEKGFFGLGKPHPKLLDRMGDYVLLAKENYSLKELLPGEDEKKLHRGHHGGLSQEEMIVPLVKMKL